MANEIAAAAAMPRHSPNALRYERTISPCLFIMKYIRFTTVNYDGVDIDGGILMRIFRHYRVTLGAEKR